MTLKITELGGGMARAGLTTKYTKDTKWGRGLRPRNDTEDHGIGWGMARVGLPANHANIANAKTMTSEMLAREGFTQRRQVRKGGLAQDGFNTKTEGNEV